MNNNDIFRRVRYALNLDDLTTINIFKLADYRMKQLELINLLKKEEETGYIVCSDAVFTAFLDGLIIHKRGKRESKPGQAKRLAMPLDNNLILKKLRIALELKEEGMINILNLANLIVTKSELTALFRRKGHRNYKECGDQFLRNFLNGLTIRERK
ncbi:MAG: DUF1456 family protein [Methanosarcinaceae archaeon]